MTSTHITPDPIDPAAAAASLSSAELLALAAAASERETFAATLAAASDRVAATLAAAVQNVADIAAAAAAAGLTAPDPATLVAAAITRATPVDPATLAAIADPAPATPPAAASTGRRTRRSIERDWSNVARGSHWTATLAGQTGKVAIYPQGSDRAMFTVLTGPDAGFTCQSPSRAVQVATGNPAGRGRRGEATVNGWIALTRDGRTLHDATVVA